MTKTKVRDLNIAAIRLCETIRLGAAFALVAACGGGPTGRASEVVVVDSSGVALVRNLIHHVDTTRVRLVEDLRLGTVDGREEEQFHRVSGVALDSLGRIFVVDQGSQAVRVFDWTGRLIRRFGGPGRGPGEFTVAGRLIVWRDTVHVQNVADAWTGALFDTVGTLLATYPGRRGRTLFSPLAGGPYGWLALDNPLFPRGALPRDGDITTNENVVWRISGANLGRLAISRGEADTLFQRVLSYRSGRIVWTEGVDGAVRGQSPLFEPEPSIAFDGRGFIYLARGWPYVIDVYDTSGTLVRRISRATEPRLVTHRLVADVLSRARAFRDTTPRGGQSMLEALEARVQLPRVGIVPATGTIRVSSNGWLWVQRPDLEADLAGLEWTPGSQPRPRHWDAFAPDGVLQFSVKLPVRFSLNVVEADEIIGILRDELNVQYVVRYRLEYTR